jgi:hypothetical protein
MLNIIDNEGSCLTNIIVGLSFMGMGSGSTCFVF